MSGDTVKLTGDQQLKLTGNSGLFVNGQPFDNIASYGTYPGYTVTASADDDDEVLSAKARSVLAALIKHVDKCGHVCIQQADDLEPDDNSLITHPIMPDETFEEFVNRLYDDLCVVRGERL